MSVFYMWSPRVARIIVYYRGCPFSSVCLDAFVEKPLDKDAWVYF